MSGRDLLFELGTEELPPSALETLRTTLRDGLAQALDDARLARGEALGLASPRHLAVLVRDVATQQPDRRQERRGPSTAVAFDEDGRPTRAAEGFARSCRVSVDALETTSNADGEWLVWRGVETGRSLAELLPAMLEQVVDALPLPKRMRWGAGDAAFIRPVHWMVLLHGDQVIPARLLGVAADRITYGHRFHHPGPISLADAGEFVERLESPGYVLVDTDRRREYIRDRVARAGSEAGGQAIIEADLLAEVTALVEWPVVLSGDFDPEFLRVPAEALVSSMQGHQKYFPVRDGAGELVPRFITVANLESRDPQQVVRGNERVIRPRLADATFFWDQDRKRTLESRVEELRHVVFQDRLGSLYDKSQRVAELAGHLAARFELDVSTTARAAMLARTDLVTEMVGEFPELQGLMGRYYALADGEPKALAEAMLEVYQPRFSGDAIAAGDLGRLLAVSERVDSLVGLFGIGRRPTGARDPFALRRAALGLVRTLIEGAIDLDLREVVDHCIHVYRKAGIALETDTGEEVVTFILERLRPYYQEQGIAVDTLDAVMAIAPPDPRDIDRRVRAIEAFRRLPEAAALTAANKRVRNLLRKATEQGEDMSGELAFDDLPDPAEQALVAAVHAAREEADPLFRTGDYASGLATLARLRGEVDRFFDQVMVLCEDPARRRQRLLIIRDLLALFLRVGELSRLQDAG